MIDDPAGQSADCPSLAIQTVLYRPTPGQLDRFIASLQAAIRFSRQCPTFAAINLTIGDCSPTRSITYEDARQLGSLLQQRGIDQFQYRFYNENLGSAGGHNALMRDFESDLLLIANPDIYMMPDLLTQLLTPLDDPKVGIVEARQLPIEHPKSFDLLTGDTSWSSTACQLLRGDVIRDVGYFDSFSFFLYGDDVDYSWRTRLMDYRVIHQPAARVFHDKRLTRRGAPIVGASEFYYSAEASLMMAWKYSRLDLLERWIDQLSNSGVADYHKAVDIFQSRQHHGELPEQLDPDGRVAQFHGQYYARHRFEFNV